MRAHQLGLQPVSAAVGADLDLGDGFFASPGQAGHAVGADAQQIAALGPDDLRLHRHRADDHRFEPGHRLALDGVFLRLEVTAKRFVECGDAFEPFHRRDAVPAGNEKPQRGAVDLVEQFAVHARRQQRVGMQRLVQR